MRLRFKRKKKKNKEEKCPFIAGSIENHKRNKIKISFVYFFFFFLPSFKTDSLSASKVTKSVPAFVDFESFHK